MKREESQHKVVQLEFQEFLELLVSRRPLKRVWPTSRNLSALRGTLLDPTTGAIYQARKTPPGSRSEKP